MIDSRRPSLFSAAGVGASLTLVGRCLALQGGSVGARCNALTCRGPELRVIKAHNRRSRFGLRILTASVVVSSPDGVDFADCWESYTLDGVDEICALSAEARTSGGKVMICLRCENAQVGSRGGQCRCNVVRESSEKYFAHYEVCVLASDQLEQFVHECGW